MEQTGLSFLLNLTANSGISGAADASLLRDDAFDASAVNAFFTIHAGLTAGDEADGAGPFAAIIENGRTEGFFHHFNAAGTGFEVDDPAEEFFGAPQAPGVDETPAVATHSNRAGFDRRLRATDISGLEIERIDRLDIATNSDERRNIVRPEVSVGVRIAKHTTPVIAQNPTRNTEPQPVVTERKPLDVAALAAAEIGRARDFGYHAGDIAIRNIASEMGASIESHKAAPGATSILGAGITWHPGDAKLTNPRLADAALSEVEGADISIDETILAEQRLGLGNEAGRTASAVVLQTPTTISAFAASAIATERFTAEENLNTSVLEPGAISTTNSVSERAPIQFASPTATPPAGAAWAQVVTAISERNGEAKLELRLNPPELGRVIISFESDGADFIRVVVGADSQQTLDLMRRNLDILQRELARNGLDNINVELADRDSNPHAHNADEQLMAYAASDDAPAYINNNIPLTTFIADGRLDLLV